MKNTLFLFATLLLIAFASCSDDGNDIPTSEEKTFITIDPSIITNGLFFDAAGGKFDFEVSSNVDFTIEIAVDWIKQTAATRGLENKRLYFTVDENTTQAKRKGTITFIYKGLKQVVKVIQVGEIPYVTFTAEAPQIFVMTPVVNALQFSLNGEDWKSLDTTSIRFSVTFGGEYGTLRLRGKSSIGTARDSYSNYSQILFGNDTPVACSGDIRTLVDYEDYENTDTSKAKFCCLFLGCTNLTTAPKLPATTLAEGCYSGMFIGCRRLTSAPELPATTLVGWCYSNMFKSCTSLTTAPKLPATTLAEGCYCGMFSGCTSLTTAPKLPATTLAEGCYSGMFIGCRRLTSAPELPATKLAELCYYSMFKSCRSLSSVPKLPATTLAEYCYYYMFWDCTSLTTVPKLPATTLKNRCYSSMFLGCTSLTSAPELPATTLVYGCYSSMFYSCTSLTTVTMLATDITAEYCLDGWLSNVSSTGTLIKNVNLSATKIKPNIPSGWAIKNYRK